MSFLHRPSFQRLLCGVPGLADRRKRSSRRNRAGAGRGHIVITGTGRAGTTLLVQLFTALGFDTGFTLTQAMGDVDLISNAGLERLHHDVQQPYVMKSPWFADHILALLEQGSFPIVAAVMPMRDLFAAAESRRRVHELALRDGRDAATQPGGLWCTTEPSEQEAKLVAQFYKLCFALMCFDVPTYTMEFPRFATQQSYFFARLRPLMVEHGVSQSEFAAAFARVVRPDKINHFTRISPSAAASHSNDGDLVPR